MSACVAAVLVGGMGARMGGPAGRVFAKSLLGLGRGVVLDHIIARLIPQVRELCLCAHDNGHHWTRFGVPVVTDESAADRAGPLAGIVAGLGWAEAQRAASLLVVPGDTPFLPPDLLAQLGAAPSVAEAGGRVHHLVCHLPVMSRPMLAAALARGHSKVGRALEALGARRVGFADASAFLNINTSEDYWHARAELGEPTIPD